MSSSLPTHASSLAASTAEHLPSYADVHSHVIVSDSRPDPYISERSFYIRTTKGVPWLTMTLRSRATSAKYLPLYCERDVIRGDVMLDLQEDMKLKEIVLKYRCTVLEGWGELNDSTVFDVVQYLWRPEGNAPYGILSKGRHILPVRFPIPTEVANPKEPGKMMALPPTFSERGGSNIYIDYTLSVSLRRPGMQISRKVSTGVGYFPQTVSGTPSLLRMLAYQNDTSIPGPELDPQGWKVITPVSVLEGTSSDIRTPSVEYTLAVAEPLSFAIGSSIPVFLTVRSCDHEALMHATAGANVQLRRSVAVGHADPKRRGSNTSYFRLARAVFQSYRRTTWDNDDENTRVLQGEVIIPRGSTPSFTWTNVDLQYDIVLCDPTTGVVPMSSKVPVFDIKPLRSVSVGITAASPRPFVILPSHPPSYAQ